MRSKHIEKLILTNEKGASIEFSVKSVFHTNISKDVTGLSDVENEIFSTSGINQAGGTYLGYHIAGRDIEIVGHIKERDKAVVREYRHQLNHALNPTYACVLIYQHDNFKRQIRCRVNSAPHFDVDGGWQRFTIDLLCLNPFWTDEAETYTQIATWIGGMEFDSVNGLQLTNSEEDPQWEVGYRLPNLITNIENTGDATTGLTITFTAQGSVSNPGLINIHSQEFLQINMDMEAGEEITVKTGYGEKSVTFKNLSGEVQDIFRYLDIQSTYLQLEIGDNPYRYYAALGEDNLNVTIKHSNLYLGV